MRKYESLDEELYHQNTLYGMLDDSYSIDKADRVLHRRRNFIFDSLNVDCISATFYDERTARYGTLIKRGGSMK